MVQADTHGMKIYVATSNAGKLADFRQAATMMDVVLEPLPGLSTLAAPEEDSDSFEGNARIKAIYYSGFAPDSLVLADDSGLEVDALAGGPGVRSARFAQDVGWVDTGLGADRNNNDALLVAMTEAVDRTARYRCALALARYGRVSHVSFGAVDGVLLDEPTGAGGFGFDPLFYVPELGCAMAEATPEQRLQVSHRGRAMRSLLAMLSSECTIIDNLCR